MRDKFLTEAMGECWHDNEEDVIQPFPKDENDPGEVMRCTKCEMGYPLRYGEIYRASLHRRNFSIWEDFGKLWNWAQQQEWFKKLLVSSNILCGYEMSIDFAETVGVSLPDELIHPDRFADAVYNFLKEK
jgi:hypothetical protein